MSKPFVPLVALQLLARYDAESVNGTEAELNRERYGNWGVDVEDEKLSPV